MDPPAAHSVLIIRDAREARSRCSLTPVRGRADLEFRTYRSIEQVFDVEGRVLLHPDGPPLSSSDRGAALLLVDSSWRRLAGILSRLRGSHERRRIPSEYTTAYPRRSENFDDPPHGLASIEALFIALAILGHYDESLLDGYHWREEFLARNQSLLRP